MSKHERIYPRKARKPIKSDRTKELEKQRRAHRRIAKGRIKKAVKKWPEHKELDDIHANPNQPAMTDYFPHDDEKPEKDKDECDP